MARSVTDYQPDAAREHEAFYSAIAASQTEEKETP
jgi:hypothetical protein